MKQYKSDFSESSLQEPSENNYLSPLQVNNLHESAFIFCSGKMLVSVSNELSVDGWKRKIMSGRQNLVCNSSKHCIYILLHNYYPS